MQQNRPQIPLDPLPEFDPEPIESCFAEHPAWCVPYNSSEPFEEVVAVVKAINPIQAYRILPSRERKSLDHHAPGWGYVAFGIVLKRLAEGVYQEPTPETVEHVAIKCLNRQVVNHYLAQGGHEDPYKEIHRMQTLGDNIHVLGLIEALQDDEHLYIIMPFCEEESLVEWIPWKEGFNEEHARQVFQQVVENLQYLRAHGICHRDLSPDNCMIYRGRVVFTDLAMSFRVNPASALTTPLGGFGKPAYLPPEIFANYPFDAYGCDLWSAAVILFNLLTGEILYYRAHANDIPFRYFIMARGISQTPVNERTVEVLESLEDSQEQTALVRLAMKCLRLSPQVQEILDNVLRFQDRWDVDKVGQAEWMRPN